MIEDTLARIEAAIKTIEAADTKKKAELLRLLRALKKEIGGVDAAHAEGAGSIAGFAGTAAYEATRRATSPKLTRMALEALSASVEGFEASHPGLVRVVNELCRELSSLGI
ncbi:MAG: hypothetical protein KGM24_03940 [Elusimicrobia bacterium]|nr:hypothetical protein [Elusimicrobiota bacterium]